MVQWKTKKKGKKVTGGKYWPARKKKLAEMGSDPTKTKVGKHVLRTRRIRGGKTAPKLISTDTANLLVDGKFKKTKIKTVKENSANRHFVRMNILTKGAVIETEDGMARITNRPSREGCINAVLIKK